MKKEDSRKTKRGGGKGNLCRTNTIRLSVNWKTQSPKRCPFGKRANPRQWAQYSVANYTTKANNSKETPMGSKLVQLGCINDRCFRRARFFDTSRLKVGQQDLPNRLEFVNLKFDWIDFSNGYFRTKLKEQFFTF